MRTRTPLLATVTVALAAGLVVVARGDDPPDTKAPTASSPATAGPPSPPAAGRQVFLKAVPQPTGRGNVEIRVGQGPPRPLNLDVLQVDADQARYADDLTRTAEVVTFRGRQAVRGPRPRAVAAAKVMNLQAGGEQELYPFTGVPALTSAEQELIVKNCLMITDLGVVEDPERTTGSGAWTFGALMTNLANRGATGIDPAEFTRRWLKSWEEDQTINSFKVANRKTGLETKILNAWQAASGGAGKPLDLTKAPFRLLAIGSRLDLRNNLVLGAERIGGGGAGEARFVFCAVDAAGGDKPLPFTVIFEYQVKRKNFRDVREWAEQWYALKDLPLGTSRYKQALQRITDQFAGPGTDPESPPNKSALSQLRTNEIALGAPWEIREFRLDVNSAGYLRQVTTKQTPDRSFNDAAVLAAYVNGSQADILAREHGVPVEFPPGKAFLSGSALTDPDAAWKAPGIARPEARHLLSFGTCSGCHAGETFPKFPGAGDDLTLDQQPFHFTHVRPRMAGKEARLSPFLTGKDKDGNPYELLDPVDGVTKRNFGGGDLTGRAHDLVGLVRYGAVYEKDRLPIQMVH